MRQLCAYRRNVQCLYYLRAVLCATLSVCVLRSALGSSRARIVKPHARASGVPREVAFGFLLPLCPPFGTRAARDHGRTAATPAEAEGVRFINIIVVIWMVVLCCARRRRRRTNSPKFECGFLSVWCTRCVRLHIDCGVRHVLAVCIVVCTRRANDRISSILNACRLCGWRRRRPCSSVCQVTLGANGRRSRWARLTSVLARNPFRSKFKCAAQKKKTRRRDFPNTFRKRISLSVRRC